MGGPCFYCTKETGRKIGCHDKCSKYLDYKKKTTKKRDLGDIDFFGYTGSAIRRMGPAGRRI